MIPAYYRNDIRFLNHIIICLQELLQHLGPSYHWDIVQLKYEAFGRELLVLSKIRQEFIQEVANGYVFDQPEIHNTQWMSPIMDFFLAYMYYCRSVNPYHKSHMMSEALDDPQTYKSSGECSKMWCKGTIHMMVQIRQEIKDRSAASKSEQEMPKSPIKLHSQNSSGPSSLPLHDDAIPTRPMPEVIEGETKDGIQVPKLQTVPLDTSSAFKGVNKKVAALDHRNLKLDQSSLNQTSLRELGNSPNKNIQILAENDVPALDLSTLFFKKLHPNSNKSLLRLAPAKRLSAVLNQKSPNQEQMQSDIAESCPAMKSQSDQHAPSQSSNTFASSDDPPSFSDYTEPWDYSLNIHMVSNEESESSLYQEVAD
ncbi:uncharacterized protein BJ212DRAFT_1302782 [Suillus subaureus]|uniref:Uncharacterized protein n=1 Tax=Suillus subaureus TaxID=48587 RepID=A0A9P7E278_9AGAM|nr:uncharacterized protein BJ212DRAFT_1302782 [Suillus subaureus]KAG1808881.1 hypothetical protein BJ212DRAFT_1302782 [Suillus subaureus]